MKFLIMLIIDASIPILVRAATLLCTYVVRFGSRRLCLSMRVLRRDGR